MPPSSSRRAAARPGSSATGRSRARARRGRRRCTRWAAAGAKTSRPAKVGPGAGEPVLGVGQLDGPGRRRRPWPRPGPAGRCRARRGPTRRRRPRRRPPGGRCRRRGRRRRAPRRARGTGRPRARASPPARTSWGGDVVGDVDDGDVGRERADDRLHHADELVGGAVVGEERDGVVAAVGGHGTDRSAGRRRAGVSRLRCTGSARKRSTSSSARR